jgi:hypothetical protein
MNPHHRRGAPCGRPLQEGGHRQGVYARLRRANGRPYKSDKRVEIFACIESSDRCTREIETQEMRAGPGCLPGSAFSCLHSWHRSIALPAVAPARAAVPAPRVGKESARFSDIFLFFNRREQVAESGRRPISLFLNMFSPGARSPKGPRPDRLPVLTGRAHFACNESVQRQAQERGVRGAANARHGTGSTR